MEMGVDLKRLAMMISPYLIDGPGAGDGVMLGVVLPSLGEACAKDKNPGVNVPRPYVRPNKSRWAEVQGIDIEARLQEGFDLISAGQEIHKYLLIRF